MRFFILIIILVYGTLTANSQCVNPISTVIGNGNNFISVKKIIDFNKDGFNDIVAVSNSNIYIYFNDGFGDFSNKVKVNNNTYANTISKLLIADFDADGDYDIVWGLMPKWTEYYDLVYISKQVADNQFIESYTGISIETNAHYKKIDINNDGYLDILIDEANGPTIDANSNAIYRTLWFENDGEGNFGDENVLGNVINHNKMIVDFDGDGLDDILVLSGGIIYNEGGFDLFAVEYRNNGSGSFTSENWILEIEDGVFSKDYFAVDYDNDGDLDFLRTNYLNPFSSFKIRLYENEGNTFSERVLVDSIGTFVFEGLVDITNDGKPEIIFRKNGLYAFENVSNNEIGRQYLITDNESATNPFCYDFDNNGWNDFLFNTHTNYEKWRLRLALNNGANCTYGCTDIDACNYDENASVLDTTCVYTCYDCENVKNGNANVGTACDDGNPYTENDLYQEDCECVGDGIVNDCLDSEIHLFANEIALQNPIKLIDLNNDGYLDVVTLNKDSVERVDFWFQVENGDFEFLQGFIVDALYTNTKYHFADMDGDGDIDVGGIAWFEDDIFKIIVGENLGDEFELKLIDTDEPRACKAIFDDFNGDGVTDILMFNTSFSLAYPTPNKLTLYTNYGDISFYVEFAIFLDVNTVDIYYEDADKDGDKDIICSAYESVMYFEQLNGGFNFSSPIGLFGTLSPDPSDYDKVMALASLDANNRPDVFSTAGPSSCNLVTISVNEQDEGETYYHQVYDPANLEELLAYDVNKDGIDELFMSSGYSVSWIEADGMGHFSVPNGLQFVKNFDLMVFNDQDEDDDKDIVSIMQNDNGLYSLFWLENNCKFAAYGIIEPDIAIDESILIYPTIAHDVININSDNVKTVSVYNSNGQLVLNQKSNNQMFVGHLFSGRYLVRITYLNGNVETSSFIKI